MSILFKKKPIKGVTKKTLKRELPKSETLCFKCDKSINKTSKYCYNCGQKQ